MDDTEGLLCLRQGCFDEVEGLDPYCPVHMAEVTAPLEAYMRRARDDLHRYDPLAVDEHVCFPGRHVPVKLHMEPWWRRLWRRIWA